MIKTSNVIQVSKLSMFDQCRYNFLFEIYDKYIPDSVTGLPKQYDKFTEELLDIVAEESEIPKHIVASHVCMFFYPEYIEFDYVWTQ